MVRCAGSLHAIRKDTHNPLTSNDGSWTEQHHELQYVDDPEYLTYFSLFFTHDSGVCSEVNTFVFTHRLAHRHHETRTEAVFQITRFHDSYHLLPKVLPQTLVLRNRPIHNHHRMVLCSK